MWIFSNRLDHFALQFGRELRERCRRPDSDRTALDGLDQLEIQARLLTGEASPYIGFKTR